MSVRTCINLEEMISEIGQTQEDNYAWCIWESKVKLMGSWEQNGTYKEL